MKMKKILSIFLSVVMVISSMAIVSAERTTVEVSTNADLITALNAGNDVKITDTFTVDDKVTVPDGTVIDLNGKTLNWNVEDSYFGTSAIKNGSIVFGKDDVHVCDGYFLINEGKTLTIDGVNITSAADGMKCYSVFHLKTGAALDVKNSTINVAKNEYKPAYVVYANEATAKADFTNSTVSTEDVAGVVHAATTITSSSFTIKGTEGTEMEHGINRSAVTIKDSDVSISGGTGRGITPTHGPLVIEGNSTVEIFDMAEASIEVRNNQTVTVAETSSVVVDTEVKAGTGTTDLVVSGTVTVNENLGSVAKVGDTYYETLTEAMGKFNGKTVEVLCDVEEDIAGFYGVTLITNVADGVTITDTNTEDWIDFDDVTVGEGVTVEIANVFSGDCEQTILGTLVVDETYYHGYDAKTTIKDGGKVIVKGSTILRYNENADAGIYIYGDGDDSTVEFDCDYYIGSYSGTFYAENANIEAGYYLLKNSYDSEAYADMCLTLDNSNITVRGTTDGQDSFIIDDQIHLTLKNGSSIDDVRDFNILNVSENTSSQSSTTTNLILSVDSTSKISATNVNISEEIPFEAIKNADGTFGVIEELVPPTTINNIDDLKAFRDAVNSGYTYKNETVTLNCDIDLNNEEWTPIGNGTYSFQGHFDGGNHTIKNLKITKPDEWDIGFFGVTKEGSVKNLIFENASITGSGDVGVVAGTPYTSDYANIKLTGHITVDGKYYVGGVGGKNAYADWTGITIDADDTSYVKADSIEDGKQYRTYVGGVVGFIGEGSHKFTNVKSNIDVLGTVCDVGGITGMAHYNNTFENCVSTGDVKIEGYKDEGDNLEMGGIAGVWHNQNGTKVTFINCEFTGTLSSTNAEGVLYTGEYENNGLVGKQYSASGTGELVIINFEWMTSTDAGFYMVSETEKVGMMRFLFAADINDEILESGIKYINTSDISAAVNATGVQGTESAFYGDVTGIPEGTDGTYLAVAYVKTAQGTYWSDVVECSPDFTKHFTEYQAQ